MGKSKIEWTDESWNPIRAKKGKWHCEKISPGCENCYAERSNIRWGGPAYTVGKDEIYLHGKILMRPLTWTTPRKTFVCSMTDLFLRHVTDDMLDLVFAVMMVTHHSTFQVLTKRAQRMAEYISNPYTEKSVKSKASAIIATLRQTNRFNLKFHRDERFLTWPIENVWLMVSTENQEFYDQRVPWLTATVWPTTGISAEPLLGPIKLQKGHRLKWVIAGGESTTSGRVCQIDWIRSLRDQTAKLDIPFFFKQWGEWLPVYNSSTQEYEYQRAGKFQSGNLLDGRTHLEYPASSPAYLREEYTTPNPLPL